MPLAPLGQVVEIFPVPGLATDELLVPVKAVTGLEGFATALTDKHLATVLPTLVLVECRQ